MTATDWDNTLATGIDADSRIGKTIASLAQQWNVAKQVANNLRASVIRRYDSYELHSAEAGKIASLRQTRAMEFLDASEEIAQRIRSARHEVREEIAAERQTIVAAFRAEAAQLRFWHIFRHAKARIRFMRRLAANKAKLALHPVALRTLRRKAILRAELRASAIHYTASDGILRHAQQAHRRETWLGPLRPAARPQTAPTGQQAKAQPTLV
jgi:hypothetical protein